MASVSRDITINVSSEDLWTMLSNIGHVQDYAPDVVSSHSLDGQRQGVGAERYCAFENGTSVKERVIDWQEERGFTLDTYEMEGFPVKTMHLTFSLEPLGPQQTRVHETITYQMKGGPLSPVLGILARGQMAQALEFNLKGMKLHAETGTPIKSREMLKQHAAA